MAERVSGLRWVRAAGLILLGLFAAWSWLFAVLNWGPAKRVDILTFKAGLTSKVMRTLLKPAQDAGHHHSHDSASISGIYATPEYYAMTEQTHEAARYQPEQFAVFYVFEDIHLGELPAAPPAASLRVDDGEPVSAMDTTVVRDSYHHRVSLVRFPNRDGEGRPFISEKASYFELSTHQPADHGQQVMRWELPIRYPQDLKETDLSLPTLFALLASRGPCRS